MESNVKIEHLIFIFNMLSYNKDEIRDKETQTEVREENISGTGQEKKAS